METHCMTLDALSEALYTWLQNQQQECFVYHSAAALRAQLALGLELAAAANLPETHRQAICWALIGRTLGWLSDSNDSQTQGPAVLAHQLAQQNAPPETAQLALRLLREIDQPPRPDDPAAQVLADTVAAELASEQLYLRWAYRRAEWNAARPPRPLTDWYADLHDLVAQTSYYTPEARSRFEAGRQARLTELRRLLGKN